MALTPTAFGQRIKRLEEQIGEPLFERTTRRVTLTEAGLALLPRAQYALEALRECLDVRGSDGHAAVGVGFHPTSVSQLPLQLIRPTSGQPREQGPTVGVE